MKQSLVNSQRYILKTAQKKAPMQGLISAGLQKVASQYKKLYRDLLDR